MAKGEALKAQIEALRSAIPELKGVLLASNEGLPIAHSLSNGADPNRVAAMAAAASSLGRRISDSMSAGTLAKSRSRPTRARCSSIRPAPRPCWRCSARKAATPV